MSYSISNLLIRNLRDIFSENDPTRRKYSGIGDARGLRAMEEFQEVKPQFRVVAPARAAHLPTQTS